jgi:four helix bundle protein
MENGFQSVQRLKVWQKSMDLVEASYKLSSQLPSDERFGLISQIRRAATSIPANIAEGFGRWNARDFARFAAIASGSLRELETHLIIVQRLGYLDKAAVDSALHLTDDLSKMLYRMRCRVLANIAASEQKPKFPPRTANQATRS